MSESIKEQVAKLNITPKLSPLRNGKYKLPDNTILKVRSDHYEHIGHRDKKEQRRLLRSDEGSLRRLLALPGFGGHNPKALEKLKKIELANLLNKKPRCFFMFRWVENPTDSKAKRIGSLMRKAVSFEARKTDQTRRKS